ncbi:MAG: DUF5667 domain-containing protein [Dehalococcoidia bacterium]
MSNRFEQRLSECLEALSSGKRTLEECLSLYPEDAAQLEPLLRTATLVGETFNVAPRAAFAAQARQRFLRMTERRLREELAAEPRRSFVMAARRRFLMAAQQVLLPRPQSRWQPAFRIAASIAAVLVVGFLSVGGFAVTTSADTLPGDWRYPVKRTMEDIRYTLTFDQGGRRQLDIEFTQKRLDEVQKLAERGSKIGEGPLSDLASQTNSLVTANLDPKDAEKVSELAQQQQEVLANVAPMVDPNASDELQAAETESSKALFVSSVLLAASPAPTPEPTSEAASTATSTPTAAAQPTQSAATAAASTPQPAVPAITPIPSAVVVAPIPYDDTAGVSWDAVVIGPLSLQVPSRNSGWKMLGLEVNPYGVAAVPSLLRVVNSDVSTIIVINPRTADMYWDQNIGGSFYESVVRRRDGAILWQATEDDLKAFSPTNADIVFHILNSIVITPLPTAVPTPPPPATPEADTSASSNPDTPTPAPGS